MMRTARAEARRAEVASRLAALPGLEPHGFRAVLARDRGVHPSTVSRDIKVIFAGWRKRFAPPAPGSLEAVILDVAAERCRTPLAQEREAARLRRELAGRFDDGDGRRNRPGLGRTCTPNCRPTKEGP